MGSGRTPLIAAMVFAGLAGQAAAACEAARLGLRAPDGKVTEFSIELADAPEERAKGLMHRESLAMSAGMLFVYPEPQRVQFWMENTLIPLDMIFADPSGLVSRVHANAVPLDRTAIDGGADVAVVLEINGGLAARLAIAPGHVIRHPALDQTLAAWPCDE